jgi:hypothetical protein
MLPPFAKGGDIYKYTFSKSISPTHLHEDPKKINKRFQDKTSTGI